MGHGGAHAALPDSQVANQHIGDAKGCVDHAQDTAMQYAACVHFMGCLGGAYGSDKQNEAKTACEEVLRDLTGGAQSALGRTNQLANDAAQGYGGTILDGYFAVGEFFGKVTGNDQIVKDAQDVRKKTSPEARDAARKRFHREWDSLWSDIKEFASKTWNEIVTMCRNGQWMVALCKFGVDLAFGVLENAVVSLLVASGVAASAGVAAKVGLIAVRQASKSGKQVFRVSLRRKDKGGNSSRGLNVAESDLKNGEERILGAENKGLKKEPTPDAGETSTKDGKKSTKAIGDAAEAQAKKDLAAKGFTDQKTITNPQGNGVDIIARNPQTGEVMFGEVKGNTARLSAVQSDLGGPAYVEDRLKRVTGQIGEWANATPQQRADAQDALEWLKQSPKFKELKYDVDPKTGKASNYREKDWDYPPGQRPKDLKWRDEDGKDIPKKKKPKKKPDATGPPAPPPLPFGGPR
jgi:Holliday junction resolvase-like predicted endonuclease